MDHARILNQIRSKDNLAKAFKYAFNDRYNNDYYFDYFELEYVYKNKQVVLDELYEELRDPASYMQRPAYAYYPPKNDLCYRRMIYITFKDLIVRYAFVIVLADILDGDLSGQCFANRRARGEQAKESLLANFVEESWPNFCQWQKELIEQNSVLLKTDISAFYDSVSHEYLITLISKELSVSDDTPVMVMFRKLLSVPVISYSLLDGTPRAEQVMRQGLAIGNSTDGFLANLYLRDVDVLMQGIKGISFGRYNDDMRIFGKDRKMVLRSVLALQELLLTKGLNLNSGKTKIAENTEQLEELRSKLSDIYSYFIVEKEYPYSQMEFEEAPKVNSLEVEIDKPFEENDRHFDINDKITDNGLAKDYCKYLSNSNLLPIEGRTPDHVRKLKDVLIDTQGSGRHASWLLIQSAFWAGMPAESSKVAQEIIFECLESEAVDYYSKYRILHHLIKKRGKTYRFRFIEKLSKEQADKLRSIMPALLEQPAFELNLIGLYVLRLLKHSYSDLVDYVARYVPKPVGDPIKNALSYIAEPEKTDGDLKIETEEEPDSKMDQY